MCASNITHTAPLSGLYLRSSISACNNIFSRSSGIHFHVFEDIPTTGVSHHRSSGVKPYLAISDFICSKLFHGLSILVTAIIIGTQADFA
ncbi:MAG: hypothetical protein WCG25_06730 [bacterium]